MPIVGPIVSCSRVGLAYDAPFQRNPFEYCLNHKPHVSRNFRNCSSEPHVMTADAVCYLLV